MKVSQTERQLKKSDGNQLKLCDNRNEDEKINPTANNVNIYNFLFQKFIHCREPCLNIKSSFNKS